MVLKSRPRVHVRVPSEIRAGDNFVARVRLHCPRPLRVRDVVVTLIGREAGREFLRLAAQVGAERDAIELDKGRNELPVRIPLPPTAPPSFAGIVRIEYELVVDVDIPWWPDRRARFEIKVIPALEERTEPRPQRYESTVGGPRGQEPYVELSLASNWARVGAVVSGALALSNTRFNPYSHVYVGIVGLESAFGSGPQEYMRYRIRLSVAGTSEGEMLLFRFRIPPHVVPQFHQARLPDGSPSRCLLRWHFELLAVVGPWGRVFRVRVPFEVLSPSAMSQAHERLAPPVVGSDRLAAVWEAAGREVGMRYVQQSLWRKSGAVELLVRRDHLGREGIFVVAELHYPDLNLGLSIEPADRIYQLLGGGIAIGNPQWDATHAVRGRDAGQTALAVSRIFQDLRRFRLRRMDDTRLTVELRDPGQSLARIAPFLRGASSLATTIEELIDNIPPPTEFRDRLDAWHELARRLNGELETSRMRIEVPAGDDHLSVRVEFDARASASAVWIGMRLKAALDSDYFVDWRQEEGTARLEQQFPGELTPMILALVDGASSLRFEPQAMSVRVARSGAGGFDTLMIERKVMRLAQLLKALRGPGGPYR